MNHFQNIFPTAIIPEGLINHTDHLGNIRVTYSKDPQTGTLEIMEENHYYPGACPEPCRRRLKHEVYSSLTPKGFIADEEIEGGTLLVHLREDEFKYKYNDYGGKSFEKAFDEHTARSAEWQDELGLNFYDYGARNYACPVAKLYGNPAIGRWMNPDPLAEKFMSVSLYNYALNNPVMFVDCRLPFFRTVYYSNFGVTLRIGKKRDEI